MGGKLTRKIGIERNEAWWGLKNLTFNFRTQSSFRLSSASRSPEAAAFPG